MQEVKRFYDVETGEVLIDTSIDLGTPKIVEKGWGHEKVIYNGNTYCGKILHFEKGKKFSLHYHLEKHESWYVMKGKFKFKYIVPKSGEILFLSLQEGDVLSIPQGVPHQLLALEEGDIFEVSTPHKDSDSYRIEKGD